MKRKRVLYVERPPLVGGSVTGLYQLVRGLDRTRYEPIVLFHGPNPYRERFAEIGVPVLTLSQTVATLPVNAIPRIRARSWMRPTAGQAVGPRPERPRQIAARLDRISHPLGATYRLAKQAYVIAARHRPLAKQIARLIEEHNVDLIHHNNSLPTNVATILAGRMVGIPQVSHVRDLKSFSAIDRYIAESVDAFVYMSTAIERRYRALGISPEKGRVIYDAFDATAFDAVLSSASRAGRPGPSTHGNGTKAIDGDRRSQIAALGIDVPCSDSVGGDGSGPLRIIANVGRLDWWKGQDYFVQAIAQLVRRNSSGRNPSDRGPIVALLIGAPDDTATSQAFYQELRQMVQELDLTDHVLFTGYRSDVPDLLALSDIVVHSASEPEPFGRVVVEAMLAGRPVIATAAGGPLDIVQDQVTGLLVPTKDASAMAEAIAELLEDPSLAERMGRKARKSAEQRFSIGQHIAAIQALYGDVLNQRPALRHN